MDRTEIQNYLPHREGMLLLDSAFRDDAGVAHATYRIPEDPFFCRGHFPGNPIVPGVILCEMMAQCCFSHMLDIFKDHLMMYRGLDNVKFRSTVKPGDLCEMESRIVEVKGSLWVCDASLSVNGKKAAQARITLAAVPK